MYVIDKNIVGKIKILALNFSFSLFHANTVLKGVTSENMLYCKLHEHLYNRKCPINAENGQQKRRKQAGDFAYKAKRW